MLCNSCIGSGCTLDLVCVLHMEKNGGQRGRVERERGREGERERERGGERGGERREREREGERGGVEGNCLGVRFGNISDAHLHIAELVEHCQPTCVAECLPKC